MDFLNAYTYGFCEKRGFTEGKGWKRSMEEMVCSTGCNAIILPVCGFQDHIWSTQIDSDTPDVISEGDVRAVCDHARSIGLKTILKAMVNCRDGTWRAYIRFFDHPVPTEPSWEEWFAAWDSHVIKVAQMAEDNKADMLCVGCETVGTDHREGEWRELIRQIRQIYHGPITYNCDKYQEDHVSWWDAVDVISSSGYYPITDLDENFQRIQAVSEKHGKPFMFMECGCPSRKGSENRPNDWRYGQGTDMEAQRIWYEAFTDAVIKYPFIRGTGWRDWSATRLYPEFAGEDNPGYCTWGKPANQVIAEFSRRVGGVLTSYVNVCLIDD